LGHIAAQFRPEADNIDKRKLRVARRIYRERGSVKQRELKVMIPFG